MRTMNMIHGFPKQAPTVQSYPTGLGVTVFWDDREDDTSPTGSTSIHLSWSSKADAIEQFRAALRDLEALS